MSDQSPEMTAEARKAKKLAKVFAKGYREMKKAHDRNLYVETDNLSSVRREVHLRNLQIQSAELAGMRRARRALVHKRMILKQNTLGRET